MEKFCNAYSTSTLFTCGSISRSFVSATPCRDFINSCNQFYILIYSINWAHGLAGIPSPTHNIFLVTVREGIIRRFSQGHTSRKEPLDIAYLKTLGTKIDLNDLLQLRSYVMFVISFEGFLRSSEVINLISNDIIFIIIISQFP